MSGVSTFLVTVVLTQWIDLLAADTSGPGDFQRTAYTGVRPAPPRTSEVPESVMVFSHFQRVAMTFLGRAKLRLCDFGLRLKCHT